MLNYRQVSGGNCRLALYRETAPGVIDASDPGVIINFFSETLNSSTPKEGSAVISGKRGDGKPIPGEPEYSGGVTIAPYAPLMGHFMRSLCGAPVTTDVSAAYAPSAAAVTDEGSGYVGLPCASNPFVQDCVITVTGTTNYNGVYRCEYGTNASKIVIKKKYVAETLTASAEIYRGRGGFLKGAAVNKGEGKVGIPLAGVGSFHEGEKVTISGTTNYDDTYTLAAGTNDRLLVIEETYVSETFDGTPFAVCKFYKHEFVLPNTQPTVTLEKYIDYEEGAAENPYFRYSSSKFNSLSFDFGGQTEIQLNLDFSVGGRNSVSAPIKENPVVLPAVPFYDREIALWMDAERIGDIQSGSCTLEYGIEGAVCVGDMGRRTIQMEGDPSSEVTLTAYVNRDEYARMEAAESVFEFKLSMDGANGEEFWIILPQAELSTNDPQIAGKGGMTVEMRVIGFVDIADAFNKFTLINRVASYA